jgi:polysaccharide biosynthesis PFTS motif protein
LNVAADDPLRSILRIASWPKYLVWDKYQDNMLREELVYNYSSEIVGPIAFSSDDSVAFECLPPKCIAVFDIEVYRFSAHFPISTYADFYCAHPDFAERFIEDIQTVLQEFDLSMAFKPKRLSYLRSRKSYLSLLKRIKNKENVRLVPSELSPLKLINECIGVISMPFTSTALYYQLQSNINIYYDPTGWFQKDDQAAHGISIISGIDELRAWVSANF